MSSSSSLSSLQPPNPPDWFYPRLISLAQLGKRLGTDGKEYYEIRYEIRGTFYSAHIEYSLWYSDRWCGKGDAKYE
jgi:hypothetical protein